MHLFLHFFSASHISFHLVDHQFANLNNFHPTEVVIRVNETQIQVSENSNVKGWFYGVKGSPSCREYLLVTVGASSVGSQWPTRESARSHHLNSNFLLLRRVDGSKQIIKLFLHLSCLFVWHLATTKHNLRARHVLSDLARAIYGTSVVAECNAWSAGKIPRPHTLQLCAPVTKVRKRGGRPQPLASEKPGITATLTERCQDPTI